MQETKNIDGRYSNSFIIPTLIASLDYCTAWICIIMNILYTDKIYLQFLISVNMKLFKLFHKVS